MAMLSERPELGGEGYRKILSASVWDARLYRWSESACMIAYVGVFTALFVALFTSIEDWRHAHLRPWMAYVRLVISLPLPFVLLYIGGATIHRRIGRKYRIF